MSNRTVTKIYVHCSYSGWGDFKDVNAWHKERGFSPHEVNHYKEPIYCGYHYLILNAFPVYTDYKEALKSPDIKFTSTTDGRIVRGRMVSQQGAHVKGDNAESIGICYIGYSPSPAQLDSLLNLVVSLCYKYQILFSNVLGHYEYYKKAGQVIEKTCPNFDMDSFRSSVKGRFYNRPKQTSIV